MLFFLGQKAEGGRNRHWRQPEVTCLEEKHVALRFPTLVLTRSGSTGIISGPWATPAREVQY